MKALSRCQSSQSSRGSGTNMQVTQGHEAAKSAEEKAGLEKGCGDAAGEPGQGFTGKARMGRRPPGPEH